MLTWSVDRLITGRNRNGNCTMSKTMPTDYYKSPGLAKRMARNEAAIACATPYDADRELDMSRGLIAGMTRRDCPCVAPDAFVKGWMQGRKLSNVLDDAGYRVTPISSSSITISK